jgi:hypothetical protein
MRLVLRTLLANRFQLKGPFGNQESRPGVSDMKVEVS